MGVRLLECPRPVELLPSQRLPWLDGCQERVSGIQRQYRSRVLFPGEPVGRQLDLGE